jgi:hypothetical protein
MRVADVRKEDIRPINASDFQMARERVRASVSAKTVRSLAEWNAHYGVSAAS